MVIDSYTQGSDHAVKLANYIQSTRLMVPSTMVYQNFYDFEHHMHVIAPYNRYFSTQVRESQQNAFSEVYKKYSL